MDDINGSIRSMLTLLDDDSSSESEAGDIDDLLSSHEDLLSKCPTYEVRACSRPSHASTLPLTPFPHAQYVPNALAGPLPIWLGYLPQLRSLRLQGNDFEYEPPASGVSSADRLLAQCSRGDAACIGLPPGSCTAFGEVIRAACPR